MNRVRLLPEQVANQIAAGEVIERPASIVKELVENSLDAGATRISVEIQAGGRSLVRVTDDGFGMSRDDALLCLERHATSKIVKAEDLASISTMGFRGEALPSIASVSRFTLTTRERENTSPEGTQIIVNGGKIIEVKAAGCATGTSVEVRQLFFNLPARRKFLRTEETEAAHVLHYLTLAALAFPEVAFTFVKDTRPVWQLPAQRSSADAAAKHSALRERLRALLGEAKLIEVDFTTEHQDSSTVPDETESFENASPTLTSHAPRTTSFRVWGLIGAPGVSRSTREDQHVFVNRRPVENRGINFALMEGYHTALMKGRYPMCCLFLEINPAAVDVNIHPAKREVKFHREREVRQSVAEAVRDALLAFHSSQSQVSGLKSKVGETVKGSPDLKGWGEHPREPLGAESGSSVASPHQSSPESFTPSLPQFPASAYLPPRSSEQPALKMGFAPARPATLTPPTAATPVTQHAIRTTSPSSTLHPPSSSPPPLLAVPLRLVGVIGRLYAVLESDRGLVLLDQHAAHERILFEQMLERLERKELAPSQKLLLPETIELSPRDANFMRGQIEALTRLGVGLSEFGEQTFLLDALPPFVKVGDARRFTLDLVDELKAAGQDVNSARLGEHVIVKTVCRHAVKANDPLAGRELENLVEDLRCCAMPYTCPHGRPTLVEMNYHELERKFGRTQ
ncbi:MAG: DNA mismatch repair endonuclease MutL [Verrucomicrobiales bacterium]|nr:MAG: DNA mismatch repair endonuclease MutL [Verrucomicrobiales bacterium]